MELDVVFGLDARHDGVAALGGGGLLVCVLGVVGLDFSDPKDRDLLVRDCEGIHSLGEPRDQISVVALLPRCEMLGLIGLG